MDKQISILLFFVYMEIKSQIYNCSRWKLNNYTIKHYVTLLHEIGVDHGASNFIEQFNLYSYVI